MNGDQGLPDVLVGWTGLVGGNLVRQREFSLHVNSTNASDLRGGRFGRVVFSAAKAEKWRANADPAADAAHVDDLVELLGSFRAEHVTLVSTVDVYGAPRGVDEDTEIDTDGLHAYGANRHRLEQAAAHLHPGALVVRLPALFGPGLKKNVVFDLLHGNQIEKIQPASEFQYYDLTRLGGDIDALVKARVRLANLVTEPVTTARVVAEAFGRDPLHENDALPVVRYDVRTRRGPELGVEGDYIESADRVLGRLRSFASSPVLA